MPYNPGVTDISGALLARGFTNAADSIAGAIDKLNERREKEKDEAKQQARLFKGLQEVAEVAYGLPKDVTTSMSLEQLEGKVKGEAVKREMAKAETNQRYVAKQIDLLNAQMTDREQAAQANARFNAKLGLETQGFGGLGGRTPDAAMILRLARESGSLNPAQAMDLVQQIEAMQGPRAGDVVDLPGLPSHKFVYGSRAGGTPIPVPRAPVDDPMAALELEGQRLLNQQRTLAVKKAQGELAGAGTGANPTRGLAVIQAKRQALDRLARQGHKSGRIVETEMGGFQVLPPSWLANDTPLPELREQLDQEEANLKLQAGGEAAPAETPAAATEPDADTLQQAAAIKRALKAKQIDEATALARLRALGFK